ncbi:MAG: FkbM family methyltransferase [Ferruginibacter sp.]
MIKNTLKKIVKNLLFKILSNKDGYADLKIRGGIARGVILRLDLRLEGSYWLGNYDQWIFDTVPFKQVIKPGQVAWDCGAYVGYYSAVFRTLVGSTGKVIAFEASNNTWQRVKQLPALNKWDNVTIHNMAVGPDHTTIKFVNNLGASNGPLNLSKIYKEAKDDLKYEEVISCGIDELVYEKGVPPADFIKFDLETGEEYALHNGQKFFTEKRPVILLELHGQKAKDAAGLFFEKYKYAGFLMYDIAEKRSPIRSIADFDKVDHVPHMVYCIPE